jgi:hypothetical protein
MEKSVMTDHPIQNITGVILAGGRSSRFGSNKALAMVDGKPLIRHVADLMSSLFAECLLVTNTPVEYRFLSLPMTSDHYRDSGPLAGIHAALLQINTDRAFVVGFTIKTHWQSLIHVCSKKTARLSGHLKTYRSGGSANRKYWQ